MNPIELRAKTFKEFLERYNYYIDYNGLQYTLATKSNDLVAITNTPDEMLNFIEGFNRGIKILEEQNLNNVRRYEGIIATLQESIPTKE